MKSTVDVPDKIIAVLFLILSFPFWPVLYLLVTTDSRGPFIFKQKRVGKDKKPFTIYKIRTMMNNAEGLKENYLHLNEVDGPVFKIRNDPRYTKIGRYLSHTGLDELPQLINVLKGEMQLVGPRPLPQDEANKIPSKYSRRFSVPPGITSSWIIQGAHSLSFHDWMKLDLEYIKNKSLLKTYYVFGKTLFLVFKLTILRIR